MKSSRTRERLIWSRKRCLHPTWRQTIVFVSLPSFSTSTSTTSPFFSQGCRHPHGDTFRRAGRDQVARFEREVRAAVADELGHGEDHVGRIRVLPGLSVTVQVSAASADHRPHRPSPGTARSGRICRALAEQPLAGSHLQVAHAQIIGGAYPATYVEGVSLGNVAGRLADRHAELDLVIELRCNIVDQRDVLPVTSERVVELGEEDGLVGIGMFDSAACLA